jgi:hypothetical protein
MISVRKLWRNICRFLVRVIEFSLRDWLYRQAYPIPAMEDRYNRID